MKMPEVVQTGMNLAEFTTWKVGGPADYLAFPENVNELQECLKWALSSKLPITILGGGSNVLVSDRGIRGLVIATREMVGVEITTTAPRLQVVAWSGSPKAQLLRAFLQNKLAPALFLAGLPGDVAGGVVMNAGVGESIVPREFCEIVDWVEVLTWEDQDPTSLKLKTYQKADIEWSYRHSHNWQPGVITRVAVSWPNTPDEKIMDHVRQATKQRLTKQPLQWPSCGSVFRNPPGQKAGALIEGCGLKGFTIGGAQVSEKHSNFIVNVASATADDIHKVLSHVRATVQSQTGVHLQTEVVYMGEW